MFHDYSSFACQALYLDSMKKSLVLIGFALFFTSCWDTPTLDTEAIRREMQTRKIQHVKKGDLVVAAEEYAKKIIASGKFDSLNAIEGISITVFDSVSIRSASEVESQLFEAYTYSIAQGTTPGSNIQFNDEKAEYLITDIKKDSTGLKMYAVRILEKVVVLR